MFNSTKPNITDYKNLNRYICGLNKEQTAYIIYDKTINLVIYALKAKVKNDVYGSAKYLNDIDNVDKFKQYLKDNYKKDSFTFVLETNISYKVNVAVLKSNYQDVIKHEFTFKDLVDKVATALNKYQLSFLKPEFKKLNEGIYEITFIDNSNRYDMSVNLIVANINTRTYDYYYKGKKHKTTAIIEVLIKPEYK